MAGAERALGRIARDLGALAAVLLRRADVDERSTQVGEHVVLEGADGVVVTLDDRVLRRNGRRDVAGELAALRDPLVAAAVEQAHVLVAEEGEHP